jgi:hypothetical protein
LFTPQGLKVSPGVNDESIKEVMGKIITRVQSECPAFRVSFYDYVDDIRYLYKTGNVEAAERVQERIVYWSGRVGVILHKKEGKYFPPSTCCPWLGFVIDTERLELSVEPAKLVELAGLVETTLEKRLLSAKEVAGVIGKLHALALVCTLAGCFLRSGYELLREEGVLSLKVFSALVLS